MREKNLLWRCKSKRYKLYMIIYLDMRDIIDLSKDATLLSSLKDGLIKRDAAIGLSFAHFGEVIKLDSIRQAPILEVIEYLPTVQMSPILEIMDFEVKQEFYRYLKIDMDIKHPDAVGPIFHHIPASYNFIDVIRHFSLKQKASIQPLEHYKAYEETIRKDLSRKKYDSVEKALTRERDNLLNLYIDKVLNPANIGLKISVLPKSLDRDDFKKNFNWDNCPYLCFYTLFQTLRYRDKGRDPRGDLADVEHATTGCMSCDILCIEKNAYEIIKQLSRREPWRVRNKLFYKLKDTIDYLKH